MKSTAIEESVFYHLKVHRWHEDLKSCVSQEVGSVKLDLHREFVEVIISILPLYLKYKKKKIDQQLTFICLFSIVFQSYYCSSSRFIWLKHSVKGRASILSFLNRSGPAES